MCYFSEPPAKVSKNYDNKKDKGGWLDSSATFLETIDEIRVTSLQQINLHLEVMSLFSSK